MIENETTQFLPFHAINEFMRPEYRQSVIRLALAAQSNLPEEQRRIMEQLTRALVQIPGFRNSAKAPAAKRLRPTVEAFEKSPMMAAAVLSTWSHQKPELRHQVYDLLTERGWELLPEEADRAQLPGFFPHWPSGDDFESLNNAFHARFPDTPADPDDISLMVVWLSVSLPYEHDDEDDDEDEIGKKGE